MKKSNVVLCAPVRTPIGTYGGSLKSVPATELGALAIRESLARAGLPPIRCKRWSWDRCCKRGLE
mgnify:CR=1 FL=1|jgi:acetyl-CoA C-acetyltransferase